MNLAPTISVTDVFNDSNSFNRRKTVVHTVLPLCNVTTSNTININKESSFGLCKNQSFLSLDEDPIVHGQPPYLTSVFPFGTWHVRWYIRIHSDRLFTFSELFFCVHVHCPDKKTRRYFAKHVCKRKFVLWLSKRD